MAQENLFCLFICRKKYVGRIVLGIVCRVHLHYLVWMIIKLQPRPEQYLPLVYINFLTVFALIYACSVIGVIDSKLWSNLAIKQIRVSIMLKWCIWTSFRQQNKINCFFLNSHFLSFYSHFGTFGGPEINCILLCVT